MFSSLGLFKQTQCPEYPHCSLTPCLFSHNHSAVPQNDGIQQTKTSADKTQQDEEEANGLGGPRKRRRIDTDAQDPHLAEKASSRTSRASSSPIPSQEDAQPPTQASKGHFDKLPRTASREISPPPLRGRARVPAKRTASTLDTTQAGATKLQSNVDGSGPASATRKAPLPKVKASEESLNPRMLHNPPASHAIRLKLLTMLHEQMSRLNDEIKKSEDASQPGLTLSDSELILQALDEEFQFARGSFAIYQNVIKSRIMVLRKMKLTIWKEERSKKIAEKLPKATPKGPSAAKPIVTDLTPAEEIAFVTRLTAQQDGLNKHGYITTMPTETELDTARKGIESAQGWEQCD
ncbi:MAG: hypothetical protein Q9204_006979, partial [Flavoplaca sp. TL-2023a]